MKLKLKHKVKNIVIDGCKVKIILNKKGLWIFSDFPNQEKMTKKEIKKKRNNIIKYLEEEGFLDFKNE